MPEILKERSELDPQFQWDLTPMFESDAAWETALDSLDADIESLAAFAGKLTDAVTIGAYLDASTEVGRKVERLYCYASQRHDEDTRDDKAQSMYACVGSKYVKMAAALSFAQPEILSLPEETLTAIVNDPAVADYKFNLEDLLRGKPHTLTKAEEKLLASFGEVMSAPSEIYHNLEDADLLFDAVKDGSGETVEVTGSNFVPLEMSTDRTLRENAFHSYYKSYREHINTFAASYAGAIKAATAEAAARNYPSSRAMAMAGENVPAEVYDNLVATVRKHIPAMHRYVRLRKKMLGVDALHFYDVYAPLVGDLKKSYSYETAQEMVLKAVAPLGEDYQGTVRKAYAERWIDVYPNRGKRGGAYSGGCYDSNPYILLNFSGTLDSVSTLAHEMALTLRGQATFGDRLVPNYQEVLGGLYSVRGYPQGIAAGDDAIAASLEYRAHVARMLDFNATPGSLFGEPFRWRAQYAGGPTDWDLLLRGFVDAGRTINVDRQSFEEDQTLVGAGFGAELSFNRRFVVRTDLGWALVGLDDAGGATIVEEGDFQWHFVATFIY